MTMERRVLAFLMRWPEAPLSRIIERMPLIRAADLPRIPSASESSSYARA